MQSTVVWIGSLAVATSIAFQSGCSEEKQPKTTLKKPVMKYQADGKIPGPPLPEIHRAARMGNIAELKRLIENGTDINQKTDLAVDHGSHLRGITPLMVAAASTEGATLETVQWLAKNGANLRL